jgi:hypothetical protein
MVQSPGLDEAERVAVVAYSRWLKRNTDKVVRASYEFSQLESPPTIEDLRNRFGTELKQSAACSTSGCGYEVVESFGAKTSEPPSCRVDSRNQLYQPKSHT